MPRRSASRTIHNSDTLFDSKFILRGTRRGVALRLFCLVERVTDRISDVRVAVDHRAAEVAGQRDRCGRGEQHHPPESDSSALSVASNHRTTHREPEKKSRCRDGKPSMQEERECERFVFKLCAEPSTRRCHDRRDRCKPQRRHCK